MNTRDTTHEKSFKNPIIMLFFKYLSIFKKTPNLLLIVNNQGGGSCPKYQEGSAAL